jgi:hypothetical protein
VGGAEAIGVGMLGCAFMGKAHSRAFLAQRTLGPPLQPELNATAFMETLELAVELRRAGYGENGERLGYDLYPYTEDAVAAVRRSVIQWNFIDEVAGRIDDGALREAQQAKDAVRAYELVYASLGA